MQTAQDNSDSYAGTLDEATRSATTGVKVHQAEVAAVMDAGDLDGAPKALVTAD
jgi:hypothetical protein